MRHDINTILRGCDQAIKAAEEAELKRFQEELHTLEQQQAVLVGKRRAAAERLRPVLLKLEHGEAPDDDELDYLYQLRWSRHELVGPQPPTRNDKPAKAYIYGLRQVLENVKRDNPGATTVSTSFLKDAGFATPVISWVTRLPAS